MGARRYGISLRVFNSIAHECYDGNKCLVMANNGLGRRVISIDGK